MAKVEDIKIIDITDAKVFPSINQERPASNTSEKYRFKSTLEVADEFAKHGWVPVQAMETPQEETITRWRRGQKIVEPNPRFGYGRHIVRFANPDLPNLKMKGDTGRADIVLKTAHDGTAGMDLMAAIWRFICSNGLMVADAMLATQKVHHIGDDFSDQVGNAIEQIRLAVPRIAGRIGDFQVPLTEAQQREYAEAALLVKYGEKSMANYSPGMLIVPERTEDEEKTLWNTFNIIQEKLVEKGGDFRFNVNEETKHDDPYHAARPVKSVTESVRLNKSLWMLTEKMHELVV